MRHANIDILLKYQETEGTKKNWCRYLRQNVKHNVMLQTVLQTQACFKLITIFLD